MVILPDSRQLFALAEEHHIVFLADEFKANFYSSWVSPGFFGDSAQVLKGKFGL